MPPLKKTAFAGLAVLAAATIGAGAALAYGQGTPKPAHCRAQACIHVGGPGESFNKWFVASIAPGVFCIGINPKLVVDGKTTVILTADYDNSAEKQVLVEHSTDQAACDASTDPNSIRVRTFGWNGAAWVAKNEAFELIIP